MLSDQQLVTTSAVLIIGYAKHCTITEYHFEIMSDLAWLNFATTQGSLLLTYRYFERSPKMRHWRALWITVEFALIFVAQLVTYHETWLVDAARSAQCTWGDMNSNWSPFWMAWLIVSLVMLTWTWTESMAEFTQFCLAGLAILYGYCEPSSGEYPNSTARSKEANNPYSELS